MTRFAEIVSALLVVLRGVLVQVGGDAGSACDPEKRSCTDDSEGSQADVDAALRSQGKIDKARRKARRPSQALAEAPVP